jgi:hypothetical protein
MKNDSSRNTFDARKHFSSVLMQQGRVQVDADWNEECDIITHRADTEASDVIGLCGGPLHYPAFHIVADATQLTPEEQKLPENKTPPKDFKPPDFLISAGRYYVDGILCENESLTSYLNQPDLPAAIALKDKDVGLYLVYVDVWQRHLTALDDPSIREVALGGPDTATRTKTVWQVKYWFAKDVKANCATKFAEFEKLIAAANGKLSARAKKEKTSTSPCLVPPGAGYTGLENQLYRVEVHGAGAAFDVTTGGAGTLVTRVPNTDNQVMFSGGIWKVNDAVEIFSSKAGSDPMNGTLSHIVQIDAGSKTLTLDMDVSKMVIEELRLRPAKATYKWSRNNAFVATSIESINVDDQEIIVHDLGPDATLGFREGQWVEISDDRLELNGLPGQLIQIAKIDPAINLITLSSQPAALLNNKDGVDKDLHPKLRGWDGIGAIKFHPNANEDHFLDLENGVQVRFFAGSFKTGDYWTVPARTATADTQSGNIEWPLDAGNKPLAQLPFGIKHHYCRLAMLYWDGDKFDPLDCRHIFPPITELTSLFYVSGDGQESMPNDPLPRPLQCGVFNWQWPVADALVRFVAQGNGRLAENQAGLPASVTNTIVVVTGADGIASCAFKLDPAGENSQQVEARLLDANQAPLPPIVRFNGNLSIAKQVFYDPGTCPTLKGSNTVQKAINKIAELISLYEVSGNDQEVMPGSKLELLRVLAANRCGPVKGQKVGFTVTVGDGHVIPDTPIVTNEHGIAECDWELDEKTLLQQVEASLIDETPPSIAAPTSVRFTANLSLMDPGIRIMDILTETDGKRLENDIPIPMDRIEKGIAIICDAPVNPESFGPSPHVNPAFLNTIEGKPTCFVTLDLPYPIGQDANFWDFTQIVGFQPLILACSVEVVERKIRWSLTHAAKQWLKDCLFPRLLKMQVTDRILAHLTLKGNFIWLKGPQDGSQIYLDGEGFGIPREDNGVDVRLPSGDTRKGGDFSMWFWLFQPSSTPDSGIGLDVAGSKNSIHGSVHDAAGTRLPGVAVMAINSATGQKKTSNTNTQGEFLFIGMESGNYQVRVEVGGDSVQQSVNVD